MDNRGCEIGVIMNVEDDVEGVCEEGRSGGVGWRVF